MTVNYTTLLGLAQPVPGTESGTWGDDVNNGITALVDSAIAGTTTITASTTLTTTPGATNQARQAILVVSSAATSAVTITAPAQSKVYLVANDSGYPANIKSSTTSGVTVAAGQYALIMWNSGLATPDFVVVASTSASGTVTSFHTSSGMGLTPSSPSSGDITLAGTLNPAFGGTGVSTLTGLAYGNGTAAFTAATAGQIVGAIGATPVTNATNATSATSATTATTATNIASGTAYQIPYQTGIGATSFIAAPSTADYYLKWTGTAFAWASVPTSGGTVTNVTGTAPVSVATGTTTPVISLASGYGDSQNPYASKAANYILAAPNGGAGVPSFRALVAADIPTLNQNTTGTAANVTGTVAAANGGTGVTTLTGIAYGNGTSAFTAATGSQIAAAIGSTAVTNATNATTAASSTNVLGGSTGSILYQSSADNTAKLSLGTTNYVLTAGASAPQYVAQSSLSVGSATTATTATNLASGAANQIAYQTASGTTSFVTAPSVSNTYLQWNGTSFAWSSAATGVTSFSAGSTGLTPNTATTGAVSLAGTLNVANGGTGTTTLTGIPYGNGTLSFTAATGTQIVTAIGTSAVTRATNIAGGSANQIHYQSGADTTAFITAPSDNTFLKYTTAGGYSWAAAGTGSVTSVSVVSANGLGGTVATSTTTPAITLTTSISGMLKGSSSALVAATDGTDYVSPSGAATLNNKRINPRVSTTTSTATLSPDISAYDQYNLTAQAATLTVAAPVGTPVDGDKLLFRILDNGTSRTISWNATYTVIGATLPTATTANKTTYVGCVYNANNTRWDVIAVTTQV